MGRRVIGLLLLLGLVVGCGTATGGAADAADTFPGASRVPTGPTGDAFYEPVTVPDDAEPGDLIRISPLPAPEGTVGFAMMYWSSTVDGRLVAVSGVVFGPTGTASGVLAWAHGTLGLGDVCAPSTGFFEGNGVSVPLVVAAAEEGLVFVASDYQGLGPPGEHPFIVNRAAAANVLDSIRAATTLMEAPEAPVAILGQSQGGSAVLAAAEMQAEYAPEIALRGAVALSVPSQLTQLDEQLAAADYDGYLVMTLFGYVVAYPQIDLTPLNETGRATLADIGTQCSDEILGASASQPASALGVDTVLDTPAFEQLLSDNDVGGVAPTVPVLLVHGEDDDTVPVAFSRALHERYCDLGATVEARFYPGAGHIDVLSDALPDIVTYLRNRLAGTPAASDCG